MAKNYGSGSIGFEAFSRQDTAGRSTQLAELNGKFNTVYTIAKEELTFTKFTPMLQLMVLLLNKRNLLIISGFLQVLNHPLRK